MQLSEVHDSPCHHQAERLSKSWMDTALGLCRSIRQPNGESKPQGFRIPPRGKSRPRCPLSDMANALSSNYR